MTDVKFEKYVKHYCKKSGNNLNALKRTKAFYQGTIQLVSAFMDVLFKFVKKFIKKIHDRASSLTSEIIDISLSELYLSKTKHLHTTKAYKHF